MEMGRRLFALRAQMDHSVFEERDHAVIDVSPLFSWVKENHSHRCGVLKNPNPIERIQRRSGDLLFRLYAEDPFPHVIFATLPGADACINPHFRVRTPA